MDWICGRGCNTMKQLEKIQAICQKDVRYDKNTKTYMYWNWSIYMNHINIMSMEQKLDTLHNTWVYNKFKVHPRCQNICFVSVICFCLYKKGCGFYCQWNWLIVVCLASSGTYISCFYPNDCQWGNYIQSGIKMWRQRQ